MANYILKDFPGKEELIMRFRQAAEPGPLQVNCHLHTPYSFSIFDNIESIFKQAASENLKVLGINDFFVADGFDEFYRCSLENRIFPMFNIEITGLLQDEQKKNIRVNDPSNPGRIYLSGKGLDYPFRLDPGMECMLQNIRYENQLHTKEIIEKAERILKELDAGMILKYSEIKRLFARELVTERHVARAIRNMIFHGIPSKPERKEFLEELIGTGELHTDFDDIPAIENQIRASLLKSGGRAFVPEAAGAFLPFDEVIQIILNAGGIPCYTVLLDDESLQCTEYEANKQILMNELLAHSIHCIEFLPVRNNSEILLDYARFFNENGFIILFGTPHSSPELTQLRISTRGGEYLSEELSELSYSGAGIIAAHQYLRAKGEAGYLDSHGKTVPNQKDEWVELGKSVINRFLKM